MKLRIKGNTIRLRLTQPEVAAFYETGLVEDRTWFQPGRSLAYALKASETADQVTAYYDDHRITVAVPSAWVAGWTQGDQVGLEGRQLIEREPPETDEVLAILVEKDFQCLHRQEGEDAGAYPHPAALEKG